MNRRVCVITGSSSGIGAATARWFAQRGHDIVVNYSRAEAPAQAVAEQCRAAGAQAIVVRADVADDAQCRALADEAMRRFGGVDTLINNAGTATKVVDIKDLDALAADDFQATYAVNVVGPYQMSRAIAPLMRSRTDPSIVNISSLAAITGAGSSIAYAASKGALNTLTLSLARSLAPAIRVNAILPGLVDSDWLRRRLGPEAFQARVERYAGRALLKKVIEPEDAARTAYWLANDAGKVTGQLVQLDAGFALG